MNRARLCLILVSSLALGACVRSMGDLEAYVAEVKARKQVRIDPIPQIKAYKAVSYVAADRRDPFVPSVSDRERQLAGGATGVSVPRPDANRNREPLEEFPIDSLRMTGTIQYQGRMYALVKAPDGVIHRVTSGDHLGQNYGKVTAVTPSEVDLTEVIPDGFGGWTERPALLALEE